MKKITRYVSLILSPIINCIFPAKSSSSREVCTTNMFHLQQQSGRIFRRSMVSSLSLSENNVLNDWLEEVQRLFSYTHWLPIERCQISFYCDNLTHIISTDDILIGFLSSTHRVRDLVDQILDSKFLHVDVPSKLDDLGELIGSELDGIYYYTQIFDFYFDKKKFQAYEGEICVGFDAEASHLLERLVSTTIKKLQVFSIVGMAGLGKTTLATKVYNDPLVVYHFYVRSWVSVSQVYQKREILIATLSSIIELSGEICSMDANMLAQVLYRALKGRRYLIVVDDIWNIEAWEDIKRSFPNDDNGSKIMLTTRLKDVALHAQSDGNPLCLRFLTEDESFDLFRKKALFVGSYFDKLNDTGKIITRKCRGLPLAIVVIAGLLKYNFDVDWWKQVAESVSSYIVSDEKQYMDTLALSYNHLPPHLRPCFLYFGAFPEDRDIPVRKLIWLWIAEGFIRHDGTKRSLEDVAEDYLMDIIKRSLVVAGNKGFCYAVKTCRIHDLLRDLCIQKAEEENFSPSAYKYIKHSNSCGHCLISDSSSLPNPRANTLLCVSNNVLNSSSNCFCFSPDSFESIWKDISIKGTSKLLRALNLSSTELLIFPTELLLLVHLRYLELCFKYGNPPETISCLTELETLIMSSRTNIVVPKKLWKIVSLRHLCIKSGENVLNFSNLEEPSTLGNLQTMSLVSPARPCEHILARTPNLRKLGLCGSLTTNHGELKCPDLGLLENLLTLKLLNTTPMCNPVVVSTSIIFPEGLKKITVSNTTLDWTEAWIFEMIPNLEVLKLKFHAFVGKDWETSLETFPRLKFLKLDELDIVTWTASRYHFPVLQRLQVYRCPYLIEIPEDFGNICTLEWIELSGCSDAATNSARDIQKVQENNGNDWLKILINPGQTPS